VTRSRVLHVLQPTVGGVPAYVTDLVGGLVDRGWDVAVASPPGAVADAVRAMGADHVPVDMVRPIRPVDDLQGIHRLTAAIHGLEPDVVHAHSTKAGVLVAASNRMRRPCVYSPHSWSFQMAGGRARTVAYARAESLLNRWGRHAVIAVSHAERRSLDAHRVAGRRRTHVIHTGLRRPPTPGDPGPSRALLGIDLDRPVAAWIGRADVQKRPQDLPRLARLLNDAGITLVALGYGLDDSDVADSIRSSGGIVAPTGTAPATVLTAASAFVQTSEWEGLPLAILEAMHAALPVAAYDVGGVGELVLPGRTGVLVPRAEVDGLARAVCGFVHVPASGERLGAAGRARARHAFAYESMLDRIESVYREVRRSGGPRA
jgi:glycosyltransferase involved in cell wall biosynthesis